MVKIIPYYAKFVARFPLLVIALSLAITFIGASFYGNLDTKNPAVDEILPADLPVVQGIKKLSDEFGGGESTAFLIVVELEAMQGSELVDIRDPQVIRYTELLANQVQAIEDVTGTSSLGESLRSLNGGIQVNSLVLSKELIENNPLVFERIVNEKSSLTVIRVFANEGFDVGFLVEEVQDIIDHTEKPLGLEVQLAGESIANKISEDLTGPDSQKTTNISLLAIIVILLITFRSFVYGLLPLFTIAFGVAWTFGFMGAAGLNLSSFTAGAISMIVGIGIDFGIQTIMRFKYELASANPALAIEHTLNNVLKPMTQATVAAFIGFWSMTLGDFSIVGELGKIMALGVVFCYFAAATVVPAISVVYEKYKPQKKLNSPLTILKRLVKLVRGKANY